MKKRKKSKVKEFIDNYTIEGQYTERYEKVIPVEHISKLEKAIKEELIEKLQEFTVSGK